VVYFARMRWTRFIKIGCSHDVCQRLKSLEREYGCPFTLLAVTYGSFAKERAIHWRFRKCGIYRGRPHGKYNFRRELFCPDKELIEYIRRLIHRKPNVSEARPSVTATTKLPHFWKRDIAAITGLNFCDRSCPCGEANELWWTSTPGSTSPDWLPGWMNGVDSYEIWQWLIENGRVPGPKRKRARRPNA